MKTLLLAPLCLGLAALVSAQSVPDHGQVFVPGIGECAVEDTENAQVRITQNPAATTGCKSIGTVLFHGLSGDRKAKNVRADAAKVGADLVWISSGRDDPKGGEAYRCATPTVGKP